MLPVDVESSCVLISNLISLNRAVSLAMHLFTYPRLSDTELATEVSEAEVWHSTPRFSFNFTQLN